MISEMRRKRAQLPFEEKIRRVGQLIQLSRKAMIPEKHKIAEILENDLGVKENYQHAPKWVTPGESIETNGAVLKWYALHPADRHPRQSALYPDESHMNIFKSLLLGSVL